jgi:hypothetical protein
VGGGAGMPENKKRGKIIHVDNLVIHAKNVEIADAENVNIRSKNIEATDNQKVANFPRRDPWGFWGIRPREVENQPEKEKENLDMDRNPN